MNRAQAKPFNRLVYVLVVCIVTGFLIASASHGQGGGNDNYDKQLTNPISLYTEKKYEDAVAVLDVLTKGNATRPEGYLWLGKANFELGKWEASRKAYEKYSELSTGADEKAKGFLGAARVHRKEKNMGLSEQFYEKAHKATPNDAAIKKEYDEVKSGDAAKADAKKDSKDAKGGRRGGGRFLEQGHFRRVRRSERVVGMGHRAHHLHPRHGPRRRHGGRHPEEANGRDGR
jgi:tetratricopeptide (TPR) repeat protein